MAAEAEGALHGLECRSGNGECRRGIQPSPSWVLSAALGVGLLLTVAGCSRPARDFSAVQAALIEHSGCEWQRTIRVGIPAGLFSVARWGLRFVDIEPEARAALDTMHGVRVAIHQLARGNADRAAMLAAADTALLPRGWDRVVGVLEQKEMVAVYLPARMKAGDLLELCVVVFDGEQLVLVSGRADPEPLVELALRHTAEQRAQWFAHSRTSR